MTDSWGPDLRAAEDRYRVARSAHLAARTAFFEGDPHGDPNTNADLTRLRNAEQEALSSFRAATDAARPAVIAPTTARTWIATPSQLKALIWVAAVTLVLAVVLAIWSGVIDPTGGYFGVDEEQLALKAGLGAWADLLGIVGIVAGVGAIVLAGVVEALRDLKANLS